MANASKQLPIILMALAYPAAVWLALQWWQPRSVALLMALLMGVRMLFTRHRARWTLCLSGLALAAVAFFANVALPLKLYPVMMNIVGLSIFGFSLWHPPTVVEQLARRSGAHLDVAAVRYTRNVTRVWCIFFMVNGTLALACGLWASSKVWALYNGLISYLLMGLLFLGEFWLRRRIQARGHHG